MTDTPTLGTVAMIGEDVVDRYLLIGLENRTANRGLIILSRSFLNPGRSFANLMGFRVPLNRDTRIGIFGKNFALRKDMLAEYQETGRRAFEFERRASPENRGESNHRYPLEAPVELTAFPFYERVAHGGNCIGGGGLGAARLNPNWQVIVELTGCVITGMPQANQSGDSLFYGGGVRWTPRAAHRLSPFA